jgi:hypothetical protein
MSDMFINQIPARGFLTMKYTKIVFPLIVLLPAVGLVACGGYGSGDGSTSSGNRTVGVDSSVSANSVTVGSTTFDTTSASVRGDAGTTNGTSTPATDIIDPGMMVVVDGPVDKATNHGTADHIDYDAEVKGAVTSNDCNMDANPIPCDIGVMGQTVHVDDMTKFKSEDPNITDIYMVAMGAYVEVSGYSDGNGNITATYIKLEKDQMQGDEDMEIEGIVANLDPDAGTFDIGEQTIHYDPAAFDLVLEDGMNVEVHVMADATDPTILNATDIQLEDDDSHGSAHDGDEVDIKGKVTSDGVADDGTFAINGETVMLGDNVKYDDGMSQDAIVMDAMIEAEGYMQDGMLIITEIGGEDSADDMGGMGNNNGTTDGMNGTGGTGTMQ